MLLVVRGQSTWGRRRLRTHSRSRNAIWAKRGRYCQTCSVPCDRRKALLQLCVFRLGLLQYGNVGVGVFPEREEIFVGGECPDAGSIGTRSLRSSRLQGIGTSYAQMRQCPRPAVPDDAVVVENLLKLGCGFLALSCGQVCLSAHIHVIEARNIGDKRNLPQLNRQSSLPSLQGNSRRVGSVGR